VYSYYFSFILFSYPVQVVYKRQVIEYQLSMPDGQHSYDTWVVASADNTYVLLIRDVTERKRAESELRIFKALIGTIDSQRAQQIMEALLEGVAQHQAELVVLDITGVAMVDTQVAQAFIQAAQAVRLLGTQVMLTGIQPQIAQTLVHLGIDLSGIQTQGSLQAGIASALRQ
jgi:anti-anti-sigma factor